MKNDRRFLFSGNEEMGSYDRFTLFMGASRARQILAVIEV